MINLEQLNRQHNSITTEFDFILDEVEKNDSLINVEAAATHISKLAGLLKMHLMEEDKFLYPRLLKCSDKEIQEMTKQYINEMGSLAEEYTKFKNDYNTKSKINAKMDLFIIDTKKIIDVLKKRISKEENELYHLIVEKNL